MKGAFCSVIAGACAADLDFDSAFFQNPASLTAAGGNWDYDYDYIKDRNVEPGVNSNNSRQTTSMLAVAYSTDQWGLGFSLTRVSRRIVASANFTDASGNVSNFDSITHASDYQFNLPFSYRINSRLNIGVTLLATTYSAETDVSGVTSSSFTNHSGLPFGFGLALGAIYSLNKDAHVGSWFRTRLTDTYDASISVVNGGSTYSYNESADLNQPFLWAVGGSWAPWSTKATFLFDLNLIGTTPGGYEITYQSFSSDNGDADPTLTAKGRRLVVDPRFGMRLPVPHLEDATLSLGTYYESSRWQGTKGFLHATGGFAYKFPKFKFLCSTESNS